MAKTIDSASRFLNEAVQCGFRESGLTIAHRGTKREKIVIGVRTSVRIDAPIAHADLDHKTCNLLVDVSYLRIVIREANAKLIRSRQRMNTLQDVLANLTAQ